MGLLQAYNGLADEMFMDKVEHESVKIPKVKRLDHSECNGCALCESDDKKDGDYQEYKDAEIDGRLIV
jgi:hypothetical protein